MSAGGRLRSTTRPRRPTSTWPTPARTTKSRFTTLRRPRPDPSFRPGRSCRSRPAQAPPRRHLRRRSRRGGWQRSQSHSASPLYWAGTATGVRYELSQSPGRVFVRYLPRGVAVGSDQPYLTIGTYLVRNAFAITSASARNAGSIRIPIDGGGVAFYSRSRPTNVYLAYPRTGIQIEVFDPLAGRARDLVASQSIAPIG